MRIKLRRIRSIQKYIPDLPNDAQYYVGIEIKGFTSKLEKVGFSKPFGKGQSILPKPVGSVSRFNAFGKDIIHRDMPKESRYINTLYWEWQQWGPGGTTDYMAEFVDVYRDCYPRTHIPAPGVEIILAEIDGKLFAIAPVLTKDQTSDDETRHVFNLFLEIFGELEILSENLQPLQRLRPHRLNWTLLPPGKQPFHSILEHLKDVVGRKSPRYSTVIQERQKFMYSLAPDECYVGNGGFREYVAYVFKSRNLVVLESITIDNAIYVFDRDWKALSQLTKAQILQNNLQKARIIHTKGWESKLKKII